MSQATQNQNFNQIFKHLVYLSKKKLKSNLFRILKLNLTVTNLFLHIAEKIPSVKLKLLIIVIYLKTNNIHKAKRVLSLVAKLVIKSNNLYHQSNFIRLSFIVMIQDATFRMRLLDEIKEWKPDPSTHDWISQTVLEYLRDGNISYPERINISECNKLWMSLIPDTPSRKSGLFKVSSLEEVMGDEFTILPEREFNFNEPKIVNRASSTPQRTVLNPRYFVKKVEAASIYSANSVISKDQFINYDSGGHPRFGKVSGTGYHFIKVTQNGDSGFGYFDIENTIYLDYGFLVSGRSSRNYFHWIVEYLPKLMAYKSLSDQLNSRVPIIVDYNMPTQHFQLLDLILANLGLNIQIIRRKPNEQIAVKNLWLANNPCYYPEDFLCPVWQNCGVSSEHLEFVRSSVFSQLNIPENTEKNIMISRKKGAMRSVENIDKIEDFLIERNFKIVYPEDYSFEQQVALFRNAENIVAQGGAALANLLFCKPGTRVTALISDRNSDYSAHRNIAAHAGCNYVHLAGGLLLDRTHFQTEEDYVHSAYRIELDDFITHFNNFHS